VIGSGLHQADVMARSMAHLFQADHLRFTGLAAAVKNHANILRHLSPWRLGHLESYLWNKLLETTSLLL
jgi:hypothetical protein